MGPHPLWRHNFRGVGAFVLAAAAYQAVPAGVGRRVGNPCVEEFQLHAMFFLRPRRRLPQRSVVLPADLPPRGQVLIAFVVAAQRPVLPAALPNSLQHAFQYYIFELRTKKWLATSNQSI